MKAIQTILRGPTDHHGARIMASDGDGNRRHEAYDHGLSDVANHRKAAEALRDALGWKGALVGGRIKNGYVWVFALDATRMMVLVDEMEHLLANEVKNYVDKDTYATLNNIIVHMRREMV